MDRSLYLVNPRTPGPTYSGGEAYAFYGLPRATLYAELALPTVAALVPPDFEVRLCDETCSSVDFDAPERFVGITGKVNQFSRAVELADAFRARGKIVLFGGSFASLSPARVRPHCDILVRGELEVLADELFADLRAGTWKAEYDGGRPELGRTVVPRWDLYPNDRCAMGAVQTSRGCPFECEFCDVIVYLGRKQRHKPVEAILAELDALYAHGYRRVFLSDDNLTVYRARARELLAALRDWNRAQVHGHVEFYTQCSVDLGRDPELVNLCAEAGLVHIFLGIETSNEASLREAKKRQNLVDQRQVVELLVQNGIAVESGGIVGFDHDGPEIFEQQLAFFQTLPVPQITFGSLVAPEGTPLHARLAAAGRVIEGAGEAVATPWNSNILPASMSVEELERGVRWLANQLYSPRSFERRVLRFVELLGPRRDPRHLAGAVASEPRRTIDEHSLELITRIPRLGALEARMFANVTAAARRKPAAKSFVGSFLLFYMHVRSMYAQAAIWDPALHDARGPSASASLST